MKRLVSLLLFFGMCSTLCACGNNEKNGNYTPTSAEDKIAYALLEQCIPNDERDGTIDILAGGPCKIYTDYADGTLVSVTTYYMNSKGKLSPYIDYGLFDGTELVKYFDDISESAELMMETIELEYSEFYVSKDVCEAVGISTYKEMWEPYVTSLACDYLMEYMNYLKNPYTIEINRVDCYVGLADHIHRYTDQVYFTVNYTSENNIGGKVTKTIGNKEVGGIRVDSSDFLDRQYADKWYFVENETYARNQSGSFLLDEGEIQTYILNNY